ncbi:MAG TPA: hypothetical protein DDZ56_05370, partial [Cytophagales bacterium]|nr:hypothetical protein [Cytophagales bacterium]
MEPIPTEHTCRNCGNHFTGLYCNQCGEKIMLPQDRSFRTFINNMFLALTFADNRFVKTVWVVISKPGFLSREFSEGRRVKYLRPLSMFFFLNLIALGGGPPFTGWMIDHIAQANFNHPGAHGVVDAFQGLISGASKGGESFALT